MLQFMGRKESDTTERLNGAVSFLLTIQRLSHIDFFHDYFFTQLSLFLTELVGHLLLVTLIFIHITIPSWLGIILDNIFPNIKLLCTSLIWPLSNRFVAHFSGFSSVSLTVYG